MATVTGLTAARQAPVNITPSAVFTQSVAPFGPAVYYANQAREVMLEGILFPTGTIAAGTNICTLPVGFRPTRNLIFACMSQTGFIEIRVLPDGTVNVGGFFPATNPSFVSITGINFRAA